MDSRLISTVARFLWLAVWVSLAAYGALTVWLGALGLTYPYQLDYGEGIVLWFARELAKGHSIYKGIVGYPYASSNYPPFAMTLSVLLMPIFGDGYTAGRLLNFAAAILVAALIYHIVTTETRDRRAGALGALFFIGSPYVYHWVPLFRADLIGLGIAFGGVYCVWKYGLGTKARIWKKTEGTKQITLPAFRLLLFAFFLFLFALYTKQTLIAAPAAAFLALFRQNKRVAILFALALGAAGSAIYLALDLATGGGFTFGLIDSNATVFLPNQLFSLLGTFAATYAVLLGLAAWEWIRRVRAGQFEVLEAYAVTSALTLVFAGRVGAWENYFFEAIAAMGVLAGCALANQQPAVRSPPPSVLHPASLVLPLLLLFQLGLYSRDHDPRIVSNLVAQDYPSNQHLGALLSRTNGVIISEDMGALVTSGKQVGYYTFQYASLARSGKWDQSWELNGLRDGIFPLVILERGTREDVDHYRRFTREFVSHLDRYYARTQTVGKYELYMPAPPIDLRSANFGDNVEIIGWRVDSLSSASSAEVRGVTIVWRAIRTMTRRYTAFVHLKTFNGEKITQDDHEPYGYYPLTDSVVYPTTRWAQGEMVRDLYILRVIPGLPMAKYVISIGWYDAETGERLEVQGSQDNSLDLLYEVK